MSTGYYTRKTWVRQFQIHHYYQQSEYPVSVFVINREPYIYHEYLSQINLSTMHILLFSLKYKSKLRNTSATSNVFVEEYCEKKQGNHNYKIQDMITFRLPLSTHLIRCEYV